MEGKKPKRPDMQIYRPPRWKDKNPEADNTKDSVNGERKNDPNHNEDSRSQQQTQQIRSRVFRRRPNRDDGLDNVEDESTAPSGNVKHQRHEEVGRRTHGKQQQVYHDEENVTSQSGGENQGDRGRQGQPKQQRPEHAVMRNKGSGSLKQPSSEYGREGTNSSNAQHQSEGRGRGGRGRGRGNSRRYHAEEEYDDPHYPGQARPRDGRENRRGDGGGKDYRNFTHNEDFDNFDDLSYPSHQRYSDGRGRGGRGGGVMSRGGKGRSQARWIEDEDEEEYDDYSQSNSHPRQSDQRRGRRRNGGRGGAAERGGRGGMHDYSRRVYDDNFDDYYDEGQSRPWPTDGRGRGAGGRAGGRGRGGKVSGLQPYDDDGDDGCYDDGSARQDWSLTGGRRGRQRGKEEGTPPVANGQQRNRKNPPRPQTGDGERTASARDGPSDGHKGGTPDAAGGKDGSVRAQQAGGRKGSPEKSGEERRRTGAAVLEDDARRRKDTAGPGVTRSGDSGHRQPSAQQHHQRAEPDRGRSGASRRTISGSSGRSATLEEEFKEDERLFNPYASAPAPMPSSSAAPSASDARLQAPPHPRPLASGLLRLPANLQLQGPGPGREAPERPVMVVRPSPAQVSAPRHAGVAGVLHVPPGLLAAPATATAQSPPDFWAAGLAPCPPQVQNYAHQLELLLQEVCDIDNRLSNLVGRHMNEVGRAREPLLEEPWWRQVGDLRHQLMRHHEALLMNYLEVCNQRQTEQGLWKSAFYAVIDPIKKALDHKRRTDLVDTALEVITEGDHFFKSCVEKLSRRYHVNIESVWVNGYLPPETQSSRSSLLALLSAQKLLLFLGDLARYRELISLGNNYGMARTWYLRAQQLAPKNGRPYHQLAVLAMYTKRQMDAMYYYMRSLACGNPFMSASQALVGLFDEVRRKVRDASRSRENALRGDGGGAGPGRSYSGTGGPGPGLSSRQAVRVEIWIHPTDGRRTQKRVDSAEEKADEDLQLLSFVELNKRFCLSFIHCHGMLFTRIGMEHFPERCALLLKEFRALLQHSPCAFSETQLLQLIFINIFNVERAMAVSSGVPGANATLRSVLFEQATRLGIDMYSLLVERAHAILDEYMKSTSSPKLIDLPRDLRPLLPAMCLWADWMIVHPHAWQPPPSLLDPHLNAPVPDEWTMLAQFGTNLDQFINQLQDTPAVAGMGERAQLKSGNLGTVVLLEEQMSAGFTPMLDQEAQLYFFERNEDEEEQLAVERRAVTDYLRLDKQAQFCEFLTEVHTPFLEYNVQTRQYCSLVPSFGSEKTTETAGDTEADPTEGPEPSGPSPTAPAAEEEARDEASSPGELGELRRRKLDLEKQLKEQEERQAIVRSALAEGSQRLIELEIVPLFVLPDTNCYIDYLGDIRQLVRSKVFTVILPIIVLNELDGLCRADDGSEPTRLIAARAKESVQFLEDEFEHRNSHLKAITAKGTHLETIAFRSETIQQEGNNDDIILSCCLHYCLDKARDFMPRSKDEPYHLHRQVVLLTSDRNLRLKAMGSNIPARPLPRFMSWAYQ